MAQRLVDIALAFAFTPALRSHLQALPVEPLQIDRPTQDPLPDFDSLSQLRHGHVLNSRRVDDLSPRSLADVVEYDPAETVVQVHGPSRLSVRLVFGCEGEVLVDELFVAGEEGRAAGCSFGRHERGGLWGVLVGWQMKGP